MVVGELILGLGYVCGGGWVLLIGAGIVAAVRLSLRHRATHRALGLPATGWFEQCPRCIEEMEVGWMPWPSRVSRDNLRKRLKGQEFTE